MEKKGGKAGRRKFEDPPAGTRVYLPASVVERMDRAYPEIPQASQRAAKFIKERDAKAALAEQLLNTEFKDYAVFSVLSALAAELQRSTRELDLMRAFALSMEDKVLALAKRIDGRNSPTDLASRRDLAERFATDGASQRAYCEAATAIAQEYVTLDLHRSEHFNKIVSQAFGDEYLRTVQNHLVEYGYVAPPSADANSEPEGVSADPLGAEGRGSSSS